MRSENVVLAGVPGTVLLSRPGLELVVQDGYLLITGVEPVALGALESIRWKARTVDRDNIFKKTRHGSVTIEWGGENEGLRVVRFEERGGDRKAEKLFEALIQATGFQSRS